ncbi:purine-cytosine permease family protein [Nocardioides luteus]|uniref:Nitrate reductase n=1 Tax=Nocardioides luteus TaxID=1844 RepID=A0A1J4NAF2_9ACTN|nr:cytosine permease [Nocardioides luteus]OIJ28532.1 nitrate reductase [Nocardioides luteus]
MALTDSTDRDEQPDAPLAVEAHSIDFIPESERHGRPRDLFAVWVAPNVNYLNLLIGGLLVAVFGLTLWQAVGVIVVGSLFTLFTGVAASSGPAAGAPSEVIMRALFGVRANRVAVLVNGWFISVCYLAINWATVAVVTFELAHRAGLATDDRVKVVLILAVSAVTLVISVYGHGLILRLYQPLAWALLVVFVVASAYVVGHADWGYRPAEPLHGIVLWASLAAAVATLASAPLSYNNSADFARYLPTRTSPAAVAWWTVIGSVLPNVIFTLVGALAATALDMTDPVAALDGILPRWFGPVFMLAVILGTVANNAMTAYSSGLSLQVVGIRWPRTRTVLLDGTVGTLMTLYAVLVSDFLSTVQNALQLAVVILGPVMSVYVADVVWRRNRYDGPGLCDTSATSPYWYSGGLNLVGVGCALAGVAVSVMGAAVVFETGGSFTGWIASALGGIDVSVWVGCLLPGLAYLVLMPRYAAARRSVVR